MSVNFNMMEAVSDYMDCRDWHYVRDAHDDLIKTGASLHCKLSSVAMVYTFNDFGFTTYTICKLKADKHVRSEVMKYITMANYGLRNGNFEMDLRDGEVRYKVYTNCDGMDDISDEVLKDTIGVSLAMFERYGNGLAALLLGFSDAETEITLAEKHRNDLDMLDDDDDDDDAESGLAKKRRALLEALGIHDDDEDEGEDSEDDDEDRA